MGFQGSLTDVRGVIQIYNYGFELLQKIYIGEESCAFSDMTLCLENNFIVTSFLTTEGLNYCAVVNIETE